MSEDASHGVLTVVMQQITEIRAEMRSDRERASESRARTYGKLEDMSRDLGDLSHRMVAMESFVEGAKPTMAKAIKMEQQARGAGALGRYLIRAGGWVLGAAVWLYLARDQIVEFWQRLR